MASPYICKAFNLCDHVSTTSAHSCKIVLICQATGQLPFAVGPQCMPTAPGPYVLWHTPYY